ncbi:MAG: hypothetical protein ACLFQK_08435 [Fibrobacterota bacterium]
MILRYWCICVVVVAVFRQTVLSVCINSGGSGLSGQIDGKCLASEIPELVIDNIIVPNGRILEIGAGSEFLFEKNKSLIVKGRLVISGTKNNPVFFRPVASLGISDDKGMWRGIFIDSSGTMEASNVIIEGSLTAVDSYSDSVSFSNVRYKNAAYSGFVLHGIKKIPGGEGKISEGQTMKRRRWKFTLRHKLRLGFMVLGGAALYPAVHFYEKTYENAKKASDAEDLESFNYLTENYRDASLKYQLCVGAVALFSVSAVLTF